MMMRMGGGGMMPGSMLLARQDVRDDLKISSDQATKLEGLRTEMMSSMRDAFREAQGDREAMGKVFEKMNADANKKVGEILTPEQNKRLQQIRIQLAGVLAAGDKDVAKDLGLSEAQNAKIKSLNDGMRAASQALMDKARNGEIEWQQVGETSQKNTDILKAEVAKVLTDAQKAKLKELEGPKFEAKDEPGR
jgi:Spy/CpxP family protein refolding chaperone